MRGITLWESRSEEDILDCLEQAYQNMGCETVENFHKHDRRHEKGVDLACQGFGETIHLQTKLKPRKGDIDQLQKLSTSTCDKKIYVYIKQPTRSFKDCMCKMEGIVDFWDSEKLDDFLISNRSHLYLRYLFLDSELVRNICKIIIKVFSYSKVHPAPLNSSILDDWWTLKDRAVKLHANLEHLELYWKDKLLSVDRHDPSLLKNVLQNIFRSFSIIGKNDARDLLSLIGTIGDKKPSVLSFYVNEVLKSSSWIGMNQLKDKLDNKIGAINLIHEWVLPNVASGSEYSLINNYLGALHRAGIAIEDGVDFVFRDFNSCAHS